MKKIWTKSVFEFNAISNQYELNESESEFYYAPDDLAIAEMKGGSSKPQTTSTTTVQNSDPWGPQQPYLTTGFQAAINAFLKDRSMPGFSDESKWAQDAQMQRARNGSPLIGQAQDEVGKTISGDYLYGGKGFDAALEAAKNKIIPGVESRFAQAGRFNSGLARTAEAGAIGDAFAGLYNNERDRMQRGTTIAPELANQDYYDIAKASEVGAQKEQMTEAQRNERRKMIEEYMKTISGNYGGTTTGTSTTTGPAGAQKSPWMSALGGGIAGATQGGMYGGPWGAGIGGGIGGLLGLLSAW